MSGCPFRVFVGMGISRNAYQNSGSWLDRSDVLLWVVGRVFLKPIARAVGVQCYTILHRPDELPTRAISLARSTRMIAMYFYHGYP